LGLTGRPPPEPGHFLTAIVAGAAFADVINVLRVNSHWDILIFGRLAGIEQSAYLMGVQDIRKEFSQGRLDLACDAESKSRLLVDAIQAGTLHAKNGYALTQSLAVPDQIDNNAFQASRIERQDGMSYLKRFGQEQISCGSNALLLVQQEIRLRGREDLSSR
jgi:hypothetical protein